MFVVIIDGIKSYAKHNELACLNNLVVYYLQIEVKNHKFEMTS